MKCEFPVRSMQVQKQAAGECMKRRVREEEEREEENGEAL